MPLPSTTQGHALKDGDIPADVVVSLMEMSDALHKGSYSLQAWPLGSLICSIFPSALSPSIVLVFCLLFVSYFCFGLPLRFACPFLFVLTFVFGYLLCLFAPLYFILFYSFFFLADVWDCVITSSIRFSLETGLAEDVSV